MIWLLLSWDFMVVREVNKDYYYCFVGKYCIILDIGLKLLGRLLLLIF